MDIEFTEKEIQKIKEIKSHYPEQKAALMPALWMIQKKYGWIPNEAIKYIAKLLDLSEAHVEGVVSFYTMYFKKPMGKYHIQVCTNVSCMLLGGEEIFSHIKNKLNISNGELTPDGKFSLEEVECMGACGGAPMIAINEDYFENVDNNKVDEIIDKLD